jgi:hypothetical protein
MLVTFVGFVIIPCFIVSGTVRYLVDEETGGISFYDLSLIF